MIPPELIDNIGRKRPKPAQRTSKAPRCRYTHTKPPHIKGTEMPTRKKRHHPQIPRNLPHTVHHPLCSHTSRFGEATIVDPFDVILSDVKRHTTSIMNGEAHSTRRTNTTTEEGILRRNKNLRLRPTLIWYEIKDKRLYHLFIELAVHSPTNRTRYISSHRESLTEPTRI